MQSGKCIRMMAEICLCKDSKVIRPVLYGWSLGKKSARKPTHHHLISQWKTYLNFASIFFRLKIDNFGKKKHVLADTDTFQAWKREFSFQNTHGRRREQTLATCPLRCMYMYLCVCMHMNVYTCICVFSVCMFVLALCAHVCMYVCMCACVVSVFTCTCVYRCMFVCGLCVCLWVFVLYVNTWMHTRVCLCWHVFFKIIQHVAQSVHFL